MELTRPWWELGAFTDEKKIAIYLDPSNGCFVRGKEDELFEVVVNLVKNAAEALPEGGDMTVRTRIAGDQVVLEVQDAGIGISKDNLGKVFDPFWSAKGGVKPGMGLAVCYGIVSRHGGTISVESEFGKGSTFTVRIPASDELPEEAQSVAGMPILRSLTVLAIDDTEPVVRFLRTALEKAHYRVLSALSGPEALEIFRGHSVDVVICDLGMPGMNGWEVGKEIRETCRERKAAKTPFIMLTGWGGQTLDKARLTNPG